MLLTNRWIGGEEAFRFGLVNRVVQKEKLHQTTEEMAKKIASYPPDAVWKAKQAIIRGLDLSLSKAWIWKGTYVRANVRRGGIG